MTGNTRHKTTDDFHIHQHNIIKQHVTLNKETNLNKFTLTKHDESTSDDIFPTLKRPFIRPKLNKKASVMSNSHQENNIKKNIIPKSIFPPTFSSRLINTIPPNFSASQLNPVAMDIFPKSDISFNTPFSKVYQPEVTNPKNSVSPSNQNNQSFSSMIPEQVTYIPLNQTFFNSTQPITTNNTLPSLLTNQSDFTFNLDHSIDSTNQTLTAFQTFTKQINDTETIPSLLSNQSNHEPINNAETIPSLQSYQSNHEPINNAETIPSLQSNQSNHELINNAETISSLQSNQSNHEPINNAETIPSLQSNQSNHEPINNAETIPSLQSNQSNHEPINNAETIPSLQSNQSNHEQINNAETIPSLQSNQSNHEPINNTETIPSLQSNQSNPDPLVASWQQYFPSLFSSSPSQNTNQKNSQLRADQGKSKYDVTVNPGQTQEIKVGEY